MKTFELSHLDPASLASYQEDLKAQKRFDRRFRPPTLVGALLVFGSPFASVFHKIPHHWTTALIVLGFVILLASTIWMFKSTPISSSGRPMKKYWCSSPKSGNTEVIYVCEMSKTYFIRVWGRPSRDFNDRD
jgi:hypothetical protein